MSRSYRHNPWVSITSAGYRRGEKRDKIIWHQQVRSKTHQILRQIRDYDDSLDVPPLPHKHEVEIWTWLKDGKQKCIQSRDTLLYWTKDGYLRK